MARGVDNYQATFRTLAASGYATNSQAGHGILVTVCSNTRPLDFTHS